MTKPFLFSSGATANRSDESEAYSSESAMEAEIFYPELDKQEGTCDKPTQDCFFDCVFPFLFLDKAVLSYISRQPLYFEFILG